MKPEKTFQAFTNAVENGNAENLAMILYHARKRGNSAAIIEEDLRYAPDNSAFFIALKNGHIAVIDTILQEIPDPRMLLMQITNYMNYNKNDVIHRENRANLTNYLEIFYPDQAKNLRESNIMCPSRPKITQALKEIYQLFHHKILEQEGPDKARIEAEDLIVDILEKLKVDETNKERISEKIPADYKYTRSVDDSLNEIANSIIQQVLEKQQEPRSTGIASRGYSAAATTSSSYRQGDYGDY